MKILREGGTSEMFRHPKGGLQKFLYFKTNRRGMLLKSLTANEGGGGAAKISSFKFQYLHPPLSY